MFFRVHRYMMSRVYKCVLTRVTAAACPCETLMKKIIQVILIQTNGGSHFLPPLNLCPEYPVQAEEGGQALLNCFLPWHRLLLGRPEYHYSWVPGASETDKVSLPSLMTNEGTNIKRPKYFNIDTF